MSSSIENNNPNASVLALLALHRNEAATEQPSPPKVQIVFRRHLSTNRSVSIDGKVSYTKSVNRSVSVDDKVSSTKSIQKTVEENTFKPKYENQMGVIIEILKIIDENQNENPMFYGNEQADEFWKLVSHIQSSKILVEFMANIGERNSSITFKDLRPFFEAALSNTFHSYAEFNRK